MWIIGVYNKWLNLKETGEVKIRTSIWQFGLFTEKAVSARQSSGFLELKMQGDLQVSTVICINILQWLLELKTPTQGAC